MKLLYFSADHCKACEPMYKFFEEYEGFKQFVDSERLVCDNCAYLDSEECEDCSEEGMTLFEKYDIKLLPTFILVDDCGEEINRAGVMSESQWNKFIQQ